MNRVWVYIKGSYALVPINYLTIEIEGIYTATAPLIWGCGS